MSKSIADTVIQGIGYDLTATTAVTVITGIEHAIQIVEEGIKTVHATGLGDDIKKALEFVCDFVHTPVHMIAESTPQPTPASSSALESIAKTLVSMNAHFANLDTLMDAQTQAISTMQEILVAQFKQHKTEAMQQ